MHVVAHRLGPATATHWPSVTGGVERLEAVGESSFHAGFGAALGAVVGRLDPVDRCRGVGGGGVELVGNVLFPADHRRVCSEVVLVAGVAKVVAVDELVDRHGERLVHRGQAAVG